MGSCCTKEEDDAIPTEDIIAPFAVIQSKNDIVQNPNMTLVGVYPIDHLIVYVYNLPSSEPQPNKFLISSNVIEVLCEQCVVDLQMIMRQITYLRTNVQQPIYSV